MLQQDLTNLNAWFKINKLSLNIQKTSVMEFWTNPSTKKLPQIKIDNIPLPTTKSTKFLGVTIDNTLAWSDHINNILRKLSINKNLIGKSRNLLNKAAKLKIYYAHIYPHLSYANTVWGGHLTQKQKNNLEKIQKILYKSNYE